MVPFCCLVALGTVAEAVGEIQGEGKHVFTATAFVPC